MDTPSGLLEELDMEAAPAKRFSEEEEDRLQRRRPLDVDGEGPAEAVELSAAAASKPDRVGVLGFVGRRDARRMLVRVPDLLPPFIYAARRGPTTIDRLDAPDQGAFMGEPDSVNRVRMRSTQHSSP